MSLLVWSGRYKRSDINQRAALYLLVAIIPVCILVRYRSMKKPPQYVLPLTNETKVMYLSVFISSKQNESRHGPFSYQSDQD